MKQIQRKTERRISAALRLVLVALLLLLQIAIVVALTQVLRQKAYIAYAVLEIVAVFCVARIYIRPGSSSYKPGWIILIMLVPVVGLILYFLWNVLHRFKRADMGSHLQGSGGARRRRGGGQPHPRRLRQHDDHAAGGDTGTAAKGDMGADVQPRASLCEPALFQLPRP